MNDGGQAFPGPVDLKSHLESGGEPFYNSGMSYRQWLIGMALCGYNANPDLHVTKEKAAVEYAIEDANNIIAALEKENETNNQKGN